MVLNEALWAYRMACHRATKVSPYQMVNGHDVLLPWQLRTGSRRTSLQDHIGSVNAYQAMNIYLETLERERFARALYEKYLKKFYPYG
jgi:hypothetical protein